MATGLFWSLDRTFQEAAGSFPPSGFSAVPGNHKCLGLSHAPSPLHHGPTVGALVSFVLKPCLPGAQRCWLRGARAGNRVSYQLNPNRSANLEQEDLFGLQELAQKPGLIIVISSHRPLMPSSTGPYRVSEGPERQP